MSSDVPLVYLVSGDFISPFGSDGFLERISRFVLLDGFLERPLTSDDQLNHSIGKSSDHADSISPENPILNDHLVFISLILLLCHFDSTK